MCKTHNCRLLVIWADGWRLLWCPECHPLYVPRFERD